MGKSKTTKEDRWWSNEVKDDWGNKCAICGSEERLNAHHLIPRQILKHKYDVENGIALCPKHHRFSFKLSAHQNPISFLVWLEENHSELLKKLKEKIKNIDNEEDY